MFEQRKNLSKAQLVPAARYISRKRLFGLFFKLYQANSKRIYEYLRDHVQSAFIYKIINQTIHLNIEHSIEIFLHFVAPCPLLCSVSPHFLAPCPHTPGSGHSAK